MRRRQVLDRSASRLPQWRLQQFKPVHRRHQRGLSRWRVRARRRFHRLPPQLHRRGQRRFGRCRPGYACFDADTTPGNNNNFCIPLCSADSECQTADAGIGCNVYSKYCESKEHGLLRYGMPCAASSECQSGFCLTGTDWPGGHCTVFCRADSSNRGSGGFCLHSAASDANVRRFYVG